MLHQKLVQKNHGDILGITFDAISDKMAINRPKKYDPESPKNIFGKGKLRT